MDDKRWDDVPAEFMPERMALMPPEHVHQLGSPDSAYRAGIKAVLGQRRFRDFFRMAWHAMDPAHLLWNWHIEALAARAEVDAAGELAELRRYVGETTEAENAKSPVTSG